MPNVLAGQYEIIKELGRGGMGVVYQARDPKHNRMVAIKELLLAAATTPDEIENFIARFQREALAASKLNHPNIVSVYDYLQEGDRHYMVMELLEGKSLQSFIDARQPFAIEQAIEIGKQLCDALDYAHAHKIVHRDIKPDNVILLENGTVKLMDFGVARHTGEVSKLTQAGTTLGTIAYISPEQLCDSRLVDGRSDLFSLGAMLYEMLTLRTPFDGGNVGATIMKIMGEDPISPRQMNPQIPGRLDAVIMRALRKNPDERFVRASEMGQALGEITKAPAAPAGRGPGPMAPVTCRGCGTSISDGRGPCPKCGRLPAPPVASAQGTAPLGTTPMGGLRPGIGPRPGTGNLPPREPGGTGGLGAPRPGFPARPATGPLSRGQRPIVGARFLYAIGEGGSRPGQFQQPRGLALDAQRQLYVADTENGRIQMLDSQGQFLREIRPAAGQSFRFPRAVTLLPNSNRLYVVDELDYRIYIFDTEGRQVQVWDRRRNAAEQIATPGRLCVSQTGTIYVSEPNSRRVMAYSSSHLFQSAYGAGGELQNPSGVAAGPRGTLHVLDYGHSRVQVFDQKGKGVMTFGRRGPAPGEFSVPRDLLVDRTGATIVADTLNHRIQIFDAQGELSCHFGQKGRGDGQFSGPEGLALSPDDQLYVSDRGNGRVLVFQLERG